MPISASDLYVLLHIGSRDIGMLDTFIKDPEKAEPEQSKCSMDFSQSKGRWMEHQYSHPWWNEDRNRRSLTGTCTESMGKEAH
jgi:hypothetical protein